MILGIFPPPPEFMSEPEFWLITLPVVGSAFLLGLVLRAGQHIQQQRIGGLGGLLGAASDQAVEFLEKATDAELAGDTLTTYLALGNLFRSRGEFDRATRIHQNILKRPNLPAEQRLVAQYQLGLDYLAAGLLDRAEVALASVVKSSSRKMLQHADALHALAGIMERQKRWEDALAVREKLSRTEGDDPAAHAHLLCQLGHDALAHNDAADARSRFEAALRLHAGCFPAWQQLIQLDAATDKPLAQQRVRDALAARPGLFHLLEAELKLAFDEAPDALSALWQAASLTPGTNWQTAAACATWLAERGEQKAARELLEKAYVQYSHTLEAAHALSQLLQQTGLNEAALGVLHTHLDEKIKTLMTYQCHGCGYSSRKVFWHCPQCQRWDTVNPISITRPAA